MGRTRRGTRSTKRQQERIERGVARRISAQSGAGSTAPLVKEEPQGSGGVASGAGSPAPRVEQESSKKDLAPQVKKEVKEEPEESESESETPVEKRREIWIDPDDL